MRIHFFVRTLNEKRGGGSTHNAISFIRALREKGHEITVHAYSSYNNEPPADISLIQHSGERKGFVEANKFLSKILKESEKDADLFFLYGVDFTWGGGMYKKQAGATPTLVYLDTYLPSMNLMYSEASATFVFKSTGYFLKRFFWDSVIGLQYAHHADHFFAVSPYVKEQFVRFGFPKEKFSVLTNFFDPIIVSSSKVKHAGKISMLYIGRFTYDKGCDLLLRVLSGLSNHQWQLRLVGGGPQRSAYEKYIKEAGLKSRVTLVSWSNKEELAKEYKNADVFVHPARWPEPFGRTVVEAMMYGVPVVVPRVGGAAWIAGDAGIEFTNGNVKELREAIEKLLSDASLRAKLGASGMIRARMFSKEEVIPQLEKTLEEVAAK
jgi:glycosyltransferase involved in cell wall biosynthesis